MPVISISKTKMMVLVWVNVAVHVAGLMGKTYAILNPEVLGATFDAIANAVVVTTGTIGLALPGVAKAVQFTDTGDTK